MSVCNDIQVADDGIDYASLTPVQRLNFRCSGLSVSSLCRDNSLQMHFRVVPVVLGGTASDVSSEHHYIYKHVSFPIGLAPFQNRYVIQDSTQ